MHENGLLQVQAFTSQQMILTYLVAHSADTLENLKISWHVSVSVLKVHLP